MLISSDCDFYIAADGKNMDQNDFRIGEPHSACAKCEYYVSFIFDHDVDAVF